MEKIPILTPDKCRKKLIPKSQRNREKLKEKLYSASGLPIKASCNHGHKNTYKCNELSSNDIFHFHRNFYYTKNKIDQDNYILKFCKTTSTNRKRPRDNTRNEKLMTVKYYIRKHRTGEVVHICKRAFMQILRIGPSRLKGVLKRHHESGLVAHERRGGDRKSFDYRSRLEAVQKFIQGFKPLEVHYCREKIRNRTYLDPTLNITRMFRLYNDQAGPGMSVTHSFFRQVFTRYFNIGFGTPRQDVCSTCIQLTEQIKNEKSVPEKQKLMINLRIHKLRANAFFQKLREEKEDLLTISFDCQKNLPLPKLADQAAYYSRQLYLYNFTAVIGSSHSTLQKSNVRSYLWTEDITAKSSNEISSAVYHCLNSLDLRNIKTVRLMADGCGGQNKNSILIGMVSKWFSEAPASLKRVEIIYPVTGHSFLPADRVFALTEKRIRLIETIVKPEEYEDIISEHAEIFKLGTEIPIYDFKSAVKETLKEISRWHFQITKVKRVILKRGKTSRRILARGELSYQSDTGVTKCLLRPTRNFSHLVPNQLNVGVKVSEAKLSDVKKLLIKHFGLNWAQLDHLNYYRNIFERDSNIEVRDDDACCEQEMEEILDFV